MPRPKLSPDVRRHTVTYRLPPETIRDMTHLVDDLGLRSYAELIERLVAAETKRVRRRADRATGEASK